MGVGYNMECKSMKEFNTQISTTIEQSKRLLSLGINPETADLMWDAITVFRGQEVEEPRWSLRTFYYPHKSRFLRDDEEQTFIPSWSLHRLLCMLEKHPYEIYLDANVYDDVIDDIAEAIRIDEFNKDYIRYFIGVDVGEDDF